MVSRENYLPFGKPDFGDGEVEAVTRVLRSGWVGMGAETIAFEQELAQTCGAAHVVTVNSCTSALFLSLLVQGIGPGDEVVVPSLTWLSTANVVRHLGATVVFCDVDADTLCVTPASVRAALTPRTRAVVVVHLGGRTAPLDAIRRAVPAHIAIVEDAAHALGAAYAPGRPVGSSGHLTCFSFYANKNLSTGEGGAIALQDEALASRLRSLRQHGLPQDAWKRYIHAQRFDVPRVTSLGYKMNYTDLQASIGRVQLRRFAELQQRRLDIARAYAEFLGELPVPVRMQTGLTEPEHARHLFVVQLPIEALGCSRDDILQAMRNRNIGASLHYQPVHTLALYADNKTAPLPVTDWLAPRILTLPISASMTLGDARTVTAALDEVLRSGAGERRAVAGRS